MLKRTNPDKEDTLHVEELFRKFYVCKVCGTRCYICVTNTWDSLPVPDRCPYEEDADVKAEWKPLFE